MSIDREKLIEIADQACDDSVESYVGTYYSFTAKTLQEFAQRIIEIETPRIRAEALREFGKASRNVAFGMDRDEYHRGWVDLCDAMEEYAQEAQHGAE